MDHLPKRWAWPPFSRIFGMMRGMDDCLPAPLLLGSPENANLCRTSDEQVGQIGSAKHPGLFSYSPSVALLAVGLT